MRAYIDHVARSGLTFQYTEQGPVGLVSGKKRVFLLAATGGTYTEGPAQAYDFGTPYLKTVLGFLGMTDVTVVTAEGVSLDAPAALVRAKGAIDALALA